MTDSKEKTPSLGTGSAEESRREDARFGGGRDEGEGEEAASAMLSVDFSTPLSGTARSERIRQLSHNHPAFEKSRLIQEILVKIQQSLRRMPGVSANESNEIVGQLQEVGQVVSRETSQLVDALINLTLDQEDTDKAIARMGLEASLTKADMEDQAQTIRDLEAGLEAEKAKRGQAEGNLQSVMGELHELTGHVKALKQKAEEEGENDPRDDIIKGLENSIRHLEEQVNNRRSLWVMKHPDPQSVARAIETLAGSVQDNNEAARQAMLSMKAACTRYPEHSPQEDDVSSRPLGDGPPPGRPPSVFQPFANSRPYAVAPPKFGPLQAGPPRAPSAFCHDRRYNGGSGGHEHGHGSSGSAWGSVQPPRAGSGPNPFYTSGASAFSRATAAPRRSLAAAYHPSRYRPAANEFHPSAHVFADGVPARPGTALGHHHHHHHAAAAAAAATATAAAAAHRHHPHQPPPRGEYLPPQTPTSTSRSRYGRFHDMNGQHSLARSSEYALGTPSGRTSQTTTANTNANNANNAINTTSTSAPTSTSTSTSTSSGALVGPLRSSLSGPLIHMTERSVAMWNESIMDFYALIRAFVERHANIPDPAMAMKMSATHLWPVLLATYHPLSAREATSYLDLHLREDNPKCCLVTRVIIDYIVNRVWTPAAWANSSDDALALPLLDVERELEQTQGQPSAHRQPLLDRQAHLIEAIIRTEPPAFHAAKVADMTASLLSLLQPLLNRLHNPADAHRDLEQVADHAWDLSSRILTSRLTFDFRFPEVGARFSSQSMLPIWPALEPSELQAKHWRVALVTTPVITCRNDTGSNISAHSVALADVYCMQ
ncbi:hypothetical protein E4U42_001283 [Claviceps africana]|uniref:Uncharacterized protein n=1 Tax=Claviceps africana TaxID=83212 RepID=A0A8K0JBW6_9HYPO|nr:hypothetical protein E4U42_001283 [Claviceps africana]